MPSVNIAPYIRNQYFNDSGVTLAGGFLYTYLAGTSTNKATYTDATGATPNANPIVLDAAGRASIYLASGAYKFVLKDSDGNTIWTEDNVSANEVTTDVDTVDNLRALTTTTAMVRTLGYTAANDGGGWWYYWDSSSSAADDGGMVIQPDSLPATGRWIGLFPSNRELNVRIYGATCDGVADDVTELQACDTYCAANNCIILIDSDLYFSTDPSLVSEVKLLPDATLSWGAFRPDMIPIIAATDLTQHFDCTNVTTPVFTLDELYPEWFGEDYTSYPITTAAFSGRSGNATKVIWNLDIGSSLDGATFVADSIVVGSPTGGNKGAGTINATGVYDDEVLLTGYVLDNYFNPEYSDEAWDKKLKKEGEHKPARAFNKRHGLMFDVDKYYNYVKHNSVLPTFEDVENSEEIPSTGTMIQKLWEVVEIQTLHIKQLHDRINELRFPPVTL